MAVKIQINSLEALERLIGGDLELELEIRNSIVQNFANKHLKGIANEMYDKGITEAVKTEIRKELFVKNGFNNVRLTDRYRPDMERHVKEFITTLIREEVDKIIAEEYVENRLRVLLDRKLVNIVKGVESQLIEEKAKELIQQKFN